MPDSCRPTTVLRPLRLALALTAFGVLVLGCESNDGPSDACPALQPTEGATCDGYPEGQVCGYYPSTAVVDSCPYSECTDGRWVSLDDSTLCGAQPLPDAEVDSGDDAGDDAGQ